MEGISSKLGCLLPLLWKITIYMVSKLCQATLRCCKAYCISKKLNPTQHDVDLVHKNSLIRFGVCTSNIEVFMAGETEVKIDLKVF